MSLTTVPLTTTVFGSTEPDTPTVLAIHGLTGHGRRWEALATEYLTDVRVVAPDLIGHGTSPWVPPWSFEEHVAALTAVVDDHLPAPRRPFVIAGHSFGGALAVRLAAALPAADLAGLVLLDPAQGLDRHWALEVATDALANWGYPDADAARAAKRSEGWADIPDRLLDKEIDDHLIDLPDGGVGWRISAPATAAAWSEMAREFVLPPAGLPTVLVVADRVDPPFVRAAFLDACAAQRGSEVEVIHADCEHMVPFLEPDLTASAIRSMLARV